MKSYFYIEIFNECSFLDIYLIENIKTRRHDNIEEEEEEEEEEKQTSNMIQLINVHKRKKKKKRKTKRWPIVNSQF